MMALPHEDPMRLFNLIGTIRSMFIRSTHIHEDLVIKCVLLMYFTD